MADFINTTLGRRTPTEALPTGLAAAVRRQEQEAIKTLDPERESTARVIAGIGSLRNALGDYGPPTTDPRSVSLYLLCEYAGKDPNHFELGPKQRNLINTIGTTPGPIATPDTLLNEIVMCGIEDFGEEIREQMTALRRERDEALDEAAEGRRKSEAAETLKKEHTELVEQVSALTGELEEVRGQLRFLRDSMPDAPTEKPKQRRTKVTHEDIDRADLDLTGIYFNNESEGRPYEIQYQDAEGSKHFRSLSVGEDVEAAIALRSELYGKPHAEPVAA